MSWLVLEDRPDRFTLLMVHRMTRRRLLPFTARDFEVKGNTTRRITVRATGTDKTFTAHPELGDKLHLWWDARLRGRTGVGLTSEIQGPPSHPSIAASAPLQPDPLQSAWAHPPARTKLQRSLWGGGLMLGIALLLATVILWQAANPHDWFYEPSETGPVEGLKAVHVFVLWTAVLVVTGAVLLTRFLRRRSLLRRQPWRLADIMSPDSDHVVLRQHTGAHGPLTYKVTTSFAFEERDRARVLACKQLWFVVRNDGTLVAATPDFLAMARLTPDSTHREAP